MLKVDTVFDGLETRCPRLGGEVPFKYCLHVAKGLPCSRALICWELLFPVAEYMKRVLTEEEWRQAFEEPGDTRMETILKVADQARKGVSRD